MIKRKKVNKFIAEFKIFIARGNILDLAVGVIIGGAFGKIVTSLVNDIITPIIGIILGGQDFSSLSIKIKDANIMYGMFMQNIIDFLIIALCVFTFMRVVNRFAALAKKPVKAEPKEKEPEREEIKLLKEIRDSLKNK